MPADEPRAWINVTPAPQRVFLRTCSPVTEMTVDEAVRVRDMIDVAIQAAIAGDGSHLMNVIEGWKKRSPPRR